MTLIYEVEHGALHTIKRKLKFGEDVNQVEYHWDIEHYDRRPVDSCPKCRDKLSESPLTKAAKLNKMAIVKFLLENGADINKGTNPLKELIRLRFFKMALFLLKNGMHHGDCFQLALLKYWHNGHCRKIVKFLLQNGFDPNNYYVQTSFPYGLLIQYGYDPYIKFECESNFIEGYHVFKKSLFEQFVEGGLREIEIANWNKKWNWRFCKKDLTEILIGLQSLNLSAYELMEIIEHTFPAVCCITLHRKWKLITTVKHFKN